jgi:serine protease Do
VSYPVTHPTTGDTTTMRPTVFMLGTAAALAASAIPSHAQDDRRDREVYVRSFGDGSNVWSMTDDRDRPVLGVSLAPSRGREDTLGVRVLTITDDGPAAKAGIEEGDRIISIDGTTLKVDPADAEDPLFRDLASRRLQRALGKHKPGDEVTLVVQRGRESRTVKVKTVAAADLSASRAFGFGPASTIIRGATSARALRDSLEARSERRPALGLSVGTTGGRRDTLGLFVNSVAADGPAEKAGIVEGVRIAAINGVDLRLSKEDVEDPEFASLRSRRFSRELEKAKPGDDVSLRVWQNGAYRTVTVKAGRAADVYKNRRGFSFSFGDGDGVFVMPPMAPMAPMLPAAPIAPRAPFVEMFPRTRFLEAMPVRPAAPAARARALVTTARAQAFRGSALRSPSVRVAPRAVAMPRYRRTVEM